ncbi:hypothetical protein ADK41_00635 [Streptomyces caelestis]|uniref:Uncharacterized protein n=1 Tax=Streptomyces caelestis TaxID=36816 RepID=A0A0M8QV58_9ACTN|nr:DUF742 domain-containing protein [Streptomyces sp. NRRL F-2305]KOT46752.1 hypothetical protein ADK41_00635 [Streptomyces caelestis]
MQTLIRPTAPSDRLASVPVLRLADRSPGIAVADIAANLRLKLTPTAALVVELENRELVILQGLVGGNDPDTDFLLRIRTGLENL